MVNQQQQRVLTAATATSLLLLLSLDASHLLFLHSSLNPSTNKTIIMKFSTSALVAVAAVAFASKTNAQTCGPQTITDMVGEDNNFGFVTYAPLAGLPSDVLNGFIGNAFSFADPAFEFCGRTDCADAGVDCGDLDLFGMPCQDPDDGISDRSLTGDQSYTHVFDIGAAPRDLRNEVCSIVRACVTTVTVAEGQNLNNGEAPGVGVSGAVTLDGELAGNLQDGDTASQFSSGTVTVQTTSDLCIDMASTLGDGELDVDIDVSLAGDHWALDYSLLEIEFDCGACPSSETAPDPHFKTFSGDWFGTSSKVSFLCYDSSSAILLTNLCLSPHPSF